MKLSFLKSLIQLVESSSIDELEYSKWGTKVRIVKSSSKVEAKAPGSAAVIGQAKGTPESKATAPAATAVAPERAAEQKLVEIKSPMVGTFYRSPSPGVKPYVEVGERVERGQVVCIIEAMKLMNEIQSEVAGLLVKVLVENAQPVEYGQPLFAVAPTQEAS